eukprot:13059043-Ditylum_brightwellii.AAC.1
MGCGIGGGRLDSLSSSNWMTWGLLCLFSLGDGVGIFDLDMGGLVCTLRSGVNSFIGVDWTGSPITLGGGTLLPACVAF